MPSDPCPILIINPRGVRVLALTPDELRHPLVRFTLPEDSAPQVYVRCGDDRSDGWQVYEHQQKDRKP